MQGTGYRSRDTGCAMRDAGCGMRGIFASSRNSQFITRISQLALHTRVSQPATHISQLATRNSHLATRNSQLASRNSHTHPHDQLPDPNRDNFLPLVGAVVILLVRSERLARWIALGATIATLAIAIPLVTGFDKSNGDLQFVESTNWIPAWNIFLPSGCGWH